MNIFQKVFDFCQKENLFKNRADVAVGVSGGADSVFLLYFLIKYKTKLGLNNIVAVHVNHNLRGNESDDDQKFVEALCKEWNVLLITKSVNVKGKMKEQKAGLEESARILRYKAFEECMKETMLDTLCLAHHQNDQAETVLMHIFRGAGLAGACGMFAKSESIVRPLLCITRQEIEQELQKLAIAFRTDSSNADNGFSRNFLRNKILPEVENIYPNAINAIFNFAENCKVDEEFIRQNLDKNYLKVEEDQTKILLAAEDLHPSLKFRLIKDAFVLAGAYKNIEQKHLLMLNELFKMKTGSMQNFPMNIVAYKDYDCISLKQAKDLQKLEEIAFEIPAKFEKNKISVSVGFAKEVKFDKDKHYLDYIKIPHEAVWRTRKNGDVFCKLGGCKKTLSNYFTDKKIVQRERDNILLLCYKNEVLLVAGYDISELVKIDETTDKVVEIKYRRK